jgi:ATP-binding cassette subfamily B protein
MASRNAVFGVLGFLFGHWRRHLRLVVMVLASIVFATAADVLLPLLSGELVTDVARPASDPALRRAVLVVLGAMTALGVLTVVARRIAFLSLTALTVHNMTEIAIDAFWRVQRFSTDWHANSFAGSIVRRVTRGMWAVDLLNDTLLVLLLPGVLVLVFATAILLVRFPEMGALLGVLSAGFIALSATLQLRYVSPSARLSNRWDSRVSGTLSDAISCNPVVKAFGAEEREDRILAGTLARWAKRTRRTWVRGTLSGNSQGAALLVLRTLVIGDALRLWWVGTVGPGDLAYVLTTIFLVQGYLRDMGQHISNIQRSVNEAEELVGLQSEPLGIEDDRAATDLAVSRGAIAFDHVVFRYASQTTRLFDGLDLRIEPGERVGLVGPSGSGKTTFVKLLQRLYDVQGGRITIDGIDIAHVRQASLRRAIAIVPQEPILFHRTLAENIAYARPGATPAEIAEAARLANASDFIERLPKGYATLVGERGVKLSGGERQRVAIARAFLSGARILVLDEATSSLDSESETLIQDAMGRLMAGRTVLVVAHRLSTVRALDRILVFRHGRIIEDGPHDALLTRDDGLYRRLFEHQALGLIAAE